MYLTNYQSKDPSKSYNMSALLATALTYHQAKPDHFESICEQNQLLIYRCFNVLNQQAELSAPQVISYLMNWGDHFTSHRYVAVFWSQLANALKDAYPNLQNLSESISISGEGSLGNMGQHKVSCFLKFMEKRDYHD